MRQEEDGEDVIPARLREEGLSRKRMWQPCHIAGRTWGSPFEVQEAHCWKT